MLKPYYVLDDCGFSGRFIRSWSWGFVFRCHKGTERRIMGAAPVNPYLINFGGPTFGWRGHNYWFDRGTLVGRLLHWLVAPC